MRNPSVTILLVEDNRVDALFMEKMLNAVYDEVAFDHATTLREALHFVERQTYDVCLLDLYLPDSEGVDTVRALHECVPNVPIVVLTSLDSASTAASTLREGARGYLVKHQLTKDIFMRAVGSAVMQHRRAIEARAEQQAPDRAMPLQALMEHLSEAMLVLDEHRVVQYANRRAEYLFGRRAARLVGTLFDAPQHPEAWTPPNVALSGTCCAVREATAEWQQQKATLVTICESPVAKPEAPSLSETICLFNDRSVCLDLIPGASSPPWLLELFEPGQPFDARVSEDAASALAEAFAHVWAERTAHRFTFAAPDHDGQCYQVEASLRMGGQSSLMLTLHTNLVPVVSSGPQRSEKGNPAGTPPRVTDRPSRTPGLSLIRSLPTPRPDSDA